ncbi:ankyrin repeat domain-containing protein [Wolbachia endosymbiont (group A) of Ennomos erosarius]|uniref:ankyrin repeat domain-containing protein n=1 Tax=Wolbachia endosymbiont (group A) of Ennomos erosarius TaxID=3066174 RepID=UPI00333F69FD
MKLNNDLILLSDRGALSISDYYSSVHKNLDLSIGLNNRIIEPEEFGERADNFSSFRYYQQDEQGLQIYHNQPINRNDIGLVDLKGKSILDFDMKVMNDTLLLSHKNNTLIKVENWNIYQPAREMMFAFNDAIVSNSKCIASTCNSEDVIVEFNKEKGQMQLDLNKELSSTVERCELSKVDNLIDRGANLETKASRGSAPLHWASWMCNVGMVKHLIERGANLETKDYNIRTPLNIASAAGRLDTVKYLIEKGADLEAKDSTGETPLSRASENGHFDIVKCLLENGADINTKSQLKDTPLDLAVKANRLGVVTLLLDRGANVNTKGRQGWTPVFWAIQKNNLNIVKLLVNNDADINAKDNEGWTPLHWAVQLGSLDIVERLVERGADVNASTADGRTPLDIARDKGYNNIVNYLEEELNKEREKPLQRKRRHHHGDHDRHHGHLSHQTLAIDLSNQPEVAASSSARPSSWINDLFSWVKSSIGGLLDSKSSTTTKSSISQIDAPMDVNGTIMLLDLLVRKVTGQKYISTVDQPISSLEAQGYALNIIEKFEKVLNETAIKSGISVTNLNFDPVAVQSTIVGQIINGRFSEISKTLYSSAKEACPEFKQTDKFLAHLRSSLEGEKEAVLLQQKVEKPSKILDQQVSRKVELSKKPDTFLNGTSVVKGISNVLER